MKTPIILVPLELLQSVKPEGKNAPKFWFGDRVYIPGSIAAKMEHRDLVPTEVKFGIIYGVDYRPSDVFPLSGGWWYRIRFDTYNCLTSYPENSIEKAEWEA